MELIMEEVRYDEEYKCWFRRTDKKIVASWGKGTIAKYNQKLYEANRDLKQREETLANYKFCLENWDIINSCLIIESEDDMGEMTAKEFVENEAGGYEAQIKEDKREIKIINEKIELLKKSK